MGLQELVVRMLLQIKKSRSSDFNQHGTEYNLGSSVNLTPLCRSCHWFVDEMFQRSSKFSNATNIKTWSE